MNSRSAPEGRFIDLSAMDCVSNYYLTALNDCSRNGHLYYLPGPSTVTGIRALQPTLQYISAARLLYAGFTYSESFAGIDGYQWLAGYREGVTTMTGHMEPGMAQMGRLLNAGVWRGADFEVSPLDRTNMLYRDHTFTLPRYNLIY